MGFVMAEAVINAESQHIPCRVLYLMCINHRQAVSSLQSHSASVKQKKELAAISEMKEKLVQKHTIRLLSFSIINTIFKEQTLKRNSEF